MKGFSFRIVRIQVQVEQDSGWSALYTIVVDNAVSQANLHLFSHIRESALSLVSDRCLPASLAAAFRHDSASRSSSSFLISSSRNKDQFTMWRRDREGEGSKPPPQSVHQKPRLALTPPDGRRDRRSLFGLVKTDGGRGRDTKLRRLLHLF